ncbi:MAG: hypothetical protein ACQ9MH_27010 [Nitrospinales bacterium]
MHQKMNCKAFHILALFTILIFFYSYATASAKYIPTEGWQSSTPEEQEMTRLDNLVKSVATSHTDGFVWLSREDGLAKDGIFRRAQFPKFMFEYPKGSKKLSTV